jgi:hypothetical protein
LALDNQVKFLIQTNIRLKDRMLNWLKEQQGKRFEKSKSRFESGEEKKPVVFPCSRCNPRGQGEHQYRGWIVSHPRYDGIHPSQFGHSCLLRIYNEMVGKPQRETHDARFQLIFDFGSALHEIFQTYGEKGCWGPNYQKEVPITGEHQQLAAELMMEGSADAENVLLIDDIPNHQYAYEVGLIHEYKSINDNGFKSLTGPKSNHVMQATVYSVVLNRPLVVYLYMNKNDSNLKDYPVAFDPVRWNALYQKGKTLVQHYDAQTEPPADVGYHCQECGYYFDCEPAKQAAAAAAIRRKQG